MHIHGFDKSLFYGRPISTGQSAIGLKCVQDHGEILQKWVNRFAAAIVQRHHTEHNHQSTPDAETMQQYR